MHVCGMYVDMFVHARVRVHSREGRGPHLISSFLSPLVFEMESLTAPEVPGIKWDVCCPSDSNISTVGLWFKLLSGETEEVQPWWRKCITVGRFGESTASSHFQFSLLRVFSYKYDLLASCFCHCVCSLSAMPPIMMDSCPSGVVEQKKLSSLGSLVTVFYHSDRKVTNTLADQRSPQDLVSAPLTLGYKPAIVPGTYTGSGDRHWDPQSFHDKSLPTQPSSLFLSSSSKKGDAQCVEACPQTLLWCQLLIVFRMLLLPETCFAF